MLTLPQRFHLPTAPHVGDDQGYSPLFDTIGHEVLRADEAAQVVGASIHRRLDETIAEVESTITVPVKIEGPEVARNLLFEIESVLTRLNYVCSIPFFLVHDFAAGLTPKTLAADVIWGPENARRREHLLAHRDELFCHVDCDLSSLLYLSIADRLELPLCLVEVPDHNFVRWVSGDGWSLNWDTNHGYDRYDDDGYARRYDASREQIERGVYLANLSRANTLGYFSFLRGITFVRNDREAEALAAYREAANGYPLSPSPRNNFAWLYVSRRSVQDHATVEEAVTYATEACDLVRDDNNLDTLACALAEAGRFEEAAVVEKEAYAMSHNPTYAKRILGFEEGKTYLDMQ